jgi:hypothetical protein
MNDSALTIYKAFSARLEALERPYYRRVRIVLQRWGELAAVYYEAGASAELAAGVLKKDPMLIVLKPLLLQCATQEAAVSYEAVQTMLANQKAAKPKLPVPTGAAERINTFISTEGAADVQNITETSRKQIREALKEIQQQGLSRQEGANLLRTRVQELSSKRAITIVRTELLTAANYGSLAGAQALGVPLLKKWIATPGDRTRIDHQLANGEKADLAGVFEDIGGEHARFPGDPNLSGRQRINCRCTIGYEPIKA